MSNTINGSTVQIDGVRFRQAGGDPAAPAASHWLLYTKAGGLYIEDSSSVVTGPFGAGGGSSGTLVVPLLNNTGSTANLGDVVVLSDSTASAFELQTYLLGPGDSNFLIGVVLDATIANGAIGNVALGGYVGQINLNASVSLSAFAWIRLAYSTQEGEPFMLPSDFLGGPVNGAFAVTLDGGTTPPAFIWNPPARYAEQRVWSQAGVNLNTTTATQLFVIPSPGPSFVLTRVVVRNASASLTTASFGFGYNSPNYDNVIASALHTELTGNTVFSTVLAKAGAALGIGGGPTALFLKCSIAQGSAATVDVDVYGYFI